MIRRLLGAVQEGRVSVWWLENFLFCAAGGLMVLHEKSGRESRIEFFRDGGHYYACRGLLTYRCGKLDKIIRELGKKYSIKPDLFKD